MNLAFYISKRLIRSKKKAFSALIMRIAIIATVISVAAMIVSTSFVNGFQKIVAEKIFDFWGDFRIEHYEPLRSTNAEASLIEKNDSLVSFIRKNPNIQSISPFVTHSAILFKEGQIEGVMIKGVSNDYPKEKLIKYLKKGVLPNWDDSSNNNKIVVSNYTANQLKSNLGDSILTFFISKDGSSPKIRKMKIAGIFNTGMDVYDQVYAIGNLDYLNKINQLSSTSINGYEIHLRDKKVIEETVSGIFPHLPIGWNSISLKDLSPEIFDWLKLQDTNKFVLIGLMLIVAVINLITCLIILLLERTNMIAILKSLGAKDGMIQTIFILYGSWIAAIGIAIGSLLGLALCFIQMNRPFIKLNEEVYFVNTAPVAIDWVQILGIAVGTFIFTMIILVIPTAISKKINISKTLQFK